MEPRALSKLLSYVLRHHPEELELSLEPAGWLRVDDLLRALLQHRGLTVDRLLLEQVVASNDKQRFAFNADGSKIRANQGHSVEVALELVACVPPQLLYHGTVLRFLSAIRAQGLVKGQRHHVHLSATIEVATQVGRRRGKPIILQVNARQMAQDGCLFYVSANGVWLTDRVPPSYIEVMALPG